MRVRRPRHVGIAIIGCGAIGSMLARAIDERKLSDARLVVLLDRSRERAEQLAAALRTRPRVARDFKQLVESRSVSVVVEASSQAAARQYVPQALRKGKDVLMMSVGAFVDADFQKQVERATRSGARVYLPSGAIGGVDAVKAASIGGLERVALTTRKPPKALLGAPGVDDRELRSISREQEVFAGSAREAISLFPANVNVAATLSLAGLGFDRTMVRIVADPSIDRNIHEVVAEGKFGRFTSRTENAPSPDNPRTSYIAGLSAMSRLVGMTNPIQLGS